MSNGSVYQLTMHKMVCCSLKKLGRSMGTRLGKGMPTSYFRKKLFTSVHYFIHLNLAISLCLGYVVFVAGVEPARANRVGDVT